MMDPRTACLHSPLTSGSSQGLDEKRTDPESMDRQLTRLSILARIGQALASNLELNPLLETIYSEVGRIFDTTNFFIALHREGSDYFTLEIHYEHGERQPVVRLDLEAGLSGYVLRTRKPLFLPYVADYLALRSREHILQVGEPAKSWMGVPLIAGERIAGVMAIQSYRQEGLYSIEDLNLFSAIASQLAMAVRNAQLYADAQRRAREMDAIASAGRDINSTLDMESVLGRIATSVLNLVPGYAVGIFFDENGEGQFRPAAVAGALADMLRVHSFQLDQGILGSVARHAMAEIIHDTTHDPRAVHIAGTQTEEEGEKLMAAPLLVRDRVIGVIGVWRQAADPLFRPEDLFFLQGIGRQASVAIQNAQLFGQARSALAQAEEASQAKSSFLANMSHELRTPLNAILLYSELLQEETQQPGMKDDLAKIQKAGRHLLGLIDDILDLSKIEAGRMSAYLEPCLIQSLLADIRATSEPLVALNRNRFLLEMDPSLTVIHTDQKKLKQVVCNLLSNAAKFTHAGTVILSLQRDEAAADWLRIQVQDTGIGLSEDQIQRIFQEFCQADESTARNYGGTGLGLTLCRRFTDLLGGEIRVTSGLGEGSTFTVRVPGLPTE